MPVRLMVIVLLAIPSAALAVLTWYGSTDPEGRAAACRSWSVQYRHTRDDLATLQRLWREARPGDVRPPDFDDYRAWVADLAAARPAGCDDNGFLR